MPPMLPYEPVTELARLYDLLRDEGKTRGATVAPIAEKLGITRRTACRGITAAVALGLAPRWTRSAVMVGRVQKMRAAYQDYLAERTAGRVEDVATLWGHHYRPGASREESNYRAALEAVASQMRLSTRTIERHLARATETGLL